MCAPLKDAAGGLRAGGAITRACGGTRRPESESGWGINFAHQGDIIFATWFTYGFDGKPLWLAAKLHRDARRASIAGDVVHRHRPAVRCGAVRSVRRTSTTVVGTMTVAFTDVRTGTFAYTVYGIAQTKAITRQEFASPVPTCVWGAQQNLALATNYQDLWWAAPAGSESGWGINADPSGRHDFRHLVHLRRRRQAAVAVDRRATDGGQRLPGPVRTLHGPRRSTPCRSSPRR